MSQQIEQLLPSRHPIAIIRLDDLSAALQLCEALLEGGITRLEFTLTNAQANEVISRAREKFAERLVVGAGTVLNAEAATTAIEAGAQFLVTPVVVTDVIEVGRQQGIPVACGAYTPTEIWTAWQAGAELVKVFPAGSLGPSYIKDMLAPLPELRLVPTGGVNLETCHAFLSAGAYTVAVGSQLVSKELVRKRDWNALTELARQYIRACGLAS